MSHLVWSYKWYEIFIKSSETLTDGIAKDPSGNPLQGGEVKSHLMLTPVLAVVLHYNITGRDTLSSIK